MRSWLGWKSVDDTKWKLTLMRFLKRNVVNVSTAAQHKKQKYLRNHTDPGRNDWLSLCKLKDRRSCLLFSSATQNCHNNMLFMQQRKRVVSDWAAKKPLKAISIYSSLLYTKPAHIHNFIHKKKESQARDAYKH